MKITDAHRRRWLKLQEVGCVCCRIEGRRCYLIEVHHLNVGGKAGQKRRGHDFSIPLCSWHHRGLPPGGKDSKWATENWGPSLAASSSKFRARYGSDDALLGYTNSLLTTLDRL